jgi:hypothetical protein
MSEPKTKDHWDKVQILGGVTAALLLPIVAGLYTLETHRADNNRLRQQAQLERASKEADRATTLGTLLVSKEPEKQRFALALARVFERDQVLPHEIIEVFESVTSDPKTAPEIKSETQQLTRELADRSKSPQVREAATKVVERAIPSVGKPNRVYMEISDGQEEKARQIADALQPLGFSTYQIESHKLWNAPDQTEVHYRFKPDFDNGNVQRLVDLLAKQFKLRSVVVSDEHKPFISHNAGHFEIRLAKD